MLSQSNLKTFAYIQSSTFIHGCKLEICCDCGRVPRQIICQNGRMFWLNVSTYGCSIVPFPGRDGSGQKWKLTNMETKIWKMTKGYSMVECLHKLPLTSTIYVESQCENLSEPMWFGAMETSRPLEISITTNFHMSWIHLFWGLNSLGTSKSITHTCAKINKKHPKTSFFWTSELWAFLTDSQHIHGTSTASVASAGFESAREGSTAGSLVAS